MSGTTSRRSAPDWKSTRLNSSHSQISYAVFCLKKKNIHKDIAEEPAWQPQTLQMRAGCIVPLNRTEKCEGGRAAEGLPMRIFFFFISAAPAEAYPLSENEGLPI